MEAKTDSLQRLAQMTRGIGAGGAPNDGADATAAGASDNARFDCTPGGSFVKLEDARLIKTEEPLQIDPLKGVSPLGAAACAVAAASDGALYQPAAGFQPAWPNFYYQQLAHSSAAAFNAAAMCNWPAAAQPQQSAAVHCSANSFPVYAPNPAKKGRQTYTRQQTLQLEDRFRENKYVTRKLRDQLRAATDLNDRQIKIWFQNRRMKEKKENQRRDNGEMEQTPLTANLPPGGGATSVKMSAMLPTAADCAAAAAANAMLHVHHPPTNGSGAHSMSHGQPRLVSHQQHLMAAAAAGEMSPVSLHKNLVSLSLNGLGSGNGGDDALLSIGDSAMTSSASSSVAASAAVANFAAGLAGGLMPAHHNPGLINAHHQMQQYLPQFDELSGVLEDDKKNMSAFGMLPNPSGQHPMTAAAMWTSINGGNAMMMPAMSTASTPMSSSSGGGSTPFGTAGLTAAMLGGEPNLAPWLMPHQLGPHAMQAGMMHAVASANNNGFGAVNGGGAAVGNYAYSLYPTNV